MSRKKFLDCNAVVRECIKAQLKCLGALPVQVQVKHKDGTVTQGDVLTARFNENSGNVVLTVQE